MEFSLFEIKALNSLLEDAEMKLIILKQSLSVSQMMKNPCKDDLNADKRKLYQHQDFIIMALNLSRRTLIDSRIYQSIKTAVQELRDDRLKEINLKNNSLIGKIQKRFLLKHLNKLEVKFLNVLPNPEDDITTENMHVSTFPIRELISNAEDIVSREDYELDSLKSSILKYACKTDLEIRCTTEQQAFLQDYRIELEEEMEACLELEEKLIAEKETAIQVLKYRSEQLQEATKQLEETFIIRKNEIERYKKFAEKRGKLQSSVLLFQTWWRTLVVNTNVLQKKGKKAAKGKKK